MKSSESFFLLNLHDVHIWYAWIPDYIQYEKLLFSFLQPDEILRAKRFLNPLHSQRFIIARGLLRYLLSRYLNLMPDQIKFGYGEKGKPNVLVGDVQFNLSHSH